MELKDTRLFKNTKVNLSNIKIVQYPNKYTVALEGDSSDKLGLVLEGKLMIKAYSLGGKNFTLNTIQPGQIFGDVLIYGTTAKTYPGVLITQGVTRIALIPYDEFEKYLFEDKNLLRNFLSLLSEKAFEMNIKSKLLSQDSIRDKILFYLQQQRRVQNSNIIQLDKTKEELANELFIQRPSLSRELIKMKQEGLISYDRKTITLK